MSVRASVVAGRLVVDQATDLPEGTVLDLVVDDEGDDLDTAERAALDDALTESSAQAQRGDLRDGDDLLKELRSRR